MNVMENVDQPPDQTPSEREAEERWVEGQYRKTCPWSIRTRKAINRWLLSVITLIGVKA
jgi:hypothetical protein